jgi:hypothetical protein
MTMCNSLSNANYESHVFELLYRTIEFEDNPGELFTVIVWNIVSNLNYWLCKQINKNKLMLLLLFLLLKGKIGITGHPSP